MKYVVTITGDDSKARAIYGEQYFPRYFHYKKEAVSLVNRLTKLGIWANWMSKSEYDRINKLPMPPKKLN